MSDTLPHAWFPFAHGDTATRGRTYPMGARRGFGNDDPLAAPVEHLPCPRCRARLWLEVQSMTAILLEVCSCGYARPVARRCPTPEERAHAESNPEKLIDALRALRGRERFQTRKRAA